MRSVGMDLRQRSTRSLLAIVAGMLALGLGLGLSLSLTGALASHDDPATIHACVNQNSGGTRLVLPGQAPNCKQNEVLLELSSAAGLAALAAQVDALEASNNEDLAERVDALEAATEELAEAVQTLQTANDNLTEHVDALEAATEDLAERVDALEAANDEAAQQLAVQTARLAELACIQSQAGLNPEVSDIVFAGCNVFVQNGMDETATANGLGNLIVGYNEERTVDSLRTGSHNLVVGPEHNYSSYGGLVAGFRNTVSGAHASVSGGRTNVASGIGASVSGGEANTASGIGASVNGGSTNTASGLWSSVSGGDRNTASGERSSVSGGASNTASGRWSTVSGGLLRSVTENTNWRGGGLFQSE